MSACPHTLLSTFYNNVRLWKHPLSASLISAGMIVTRPAFKKVISSMSLGQRWTHWFCVSGIWEPFHVGGYPAEDPCDTSMAACSWSNIKVEGSPDSRNWHLHPSSDCSNLLTSIMDHVLWIRTYKWLQLHCIETLHEATYFFQDFRKDVLGFTVRCYCSIIQLYMRGKWMIYGDSGSPLCHP